MILPHWFLNDSLPANNSSLSFFKCIISYLSLKNLKRQLVCWMKWIENMHNEMKICKYFDDSWLFGTSTSLIAYVFPENFRALQIIIKLFWCKGILGCHYVYVYSYKSLTFGGIKKNTFLRRASGSLVFAWYHNFDDYT